MRLLVLRLLCVAIAATACNASAYSRELDSAVSAAYAELSLSPPTSAVLTVCHGFGCRNRTEVAFSAADRIKMTQILRGGQASPAAERRAIAAVVAWFDQRVGPEAGTQHHVARAGLAEMSNPDLQFDCVDASRNTTSLLLVLDELHLLKHHRVEEAVARGALLDGRWPHLTAVVAELASQKKWAVDSWTHAAGEQPDILPLEQWFQSRY